MKIEITSTKDLGAVSKAVRKSQEFDQSTLGLFSGNSVNFVSQFENGKETIEIGRVLEVFEALGIKLIMDIPEPVQDTSMHLMYKYLNKANLWPENFSLKNHKKVIVKKL